MPLDATLLLQSRQRPVGIRLVASDRFATCCRATLAALGRHTPPDSAESFEVFGLRRCDT
jgi:hypothetical protein